MQVDISSFRQYHYAVPMKKALLLGFAVFFLLLPFKAFAQESTPVPSVVVEEQIELDTSASPSAKEQVGYTLVYPGMLPDNPLHFVKAARDRIISILISNQVKKAEFNILTSDKRFVAAQMLFQRNKGKLAASTLSKSNNYMNEAISAIRQAQKSDANYNSVLHNLSLSIDKHLEVLETFTEDVDEEFLDQLEAERKRLLEFKNSVKEIAPGN